ncbi:unnamed protein product, partial [marine sediment metagenome]
MHPALLRQAAELSLNSGGCIKFDLKAWSEELHIALCGVSNKRTLENFKWLAQYAEKRQSPPFLVASTLLEIASSLKEKYGSLEGLYTRSKDSKDLEKRLLEFKGVGPTTVNIFLRELRAVWEKARPQLSPLAREVASRLGLGEEELELPAVESALVRLNLEFCKRRRCSSCPVREECQ